MTDHGRGSKKRQGSIRRKVIILLLTMVLTALSVSGTVSLWSLYSMRALSEESSKMLGQMAAEDGEAALEELAGGQLLIVASQKAAYIEEKFNTVIADVNGIARAAEDIYRNPEKYPDRETALPQRGSTELAAQLLRSARLKYPSPKQYEELYRLGNLQELLVQYNANNDMISSTYLATQSGWMLQADYIAYSKYSGGQDLPDYYEADTRQWYQRAKLASPGECVYTDVIRDIHEGKECIVCSRAVYIDGEIVAVAGIGSYLDTVKQTVLDTAIGQSGYAFLVNDKGQILVSSAQTGETAGQFSHEDLRKSENKPLATAAEDMVAGGSSLVRLKMDGREVYLAYAPLPGLHWSFVTVMDVEEVIAPVRDNQNRILAMTEGILDKQDVAIRRTIFLFLGIMSAAAVLIGAVGILFSNRLTDPIRRLTREVKRIDGGNLDTPVCFAIGIDTGIDTGDEVEDLGHAFHDMTVQLKTYIENLAAITAEKERVHTELSLASKIQADMLPDYEEILRERREFDLYASMTPAKEVGGDFYDFFLTDEDHLAILIADVSGKGVPAALFMVVAKTLLQSRIREAGTLSEAVEAVNERLCACNKNGMFVTVWIGVLTLSTGLLTYVNAGHNPPLIGNAQKGYEYIDSRDGFVLAGMGGMSYRQHCIKMREGDLLFLYTDGVTEANDCRGDFYGDARLKALLGSCRETDPDRLALTVQNDLRGFQGAAGQFDDITMLVLCYRGWNRIFTGAVSGTQSGTIQEFVERSFEGQGISQRAVHRFLIALDEVYSNICRYSRAQNFTVECRKECAGEEEPGTDAGKKRYILTLEDDGIEFDPLQFPRPDLKKPLEERSPGGLGIYMVRELMDEVFYERKDGRNRLSMTVIQ